MLTSLFYQIKSSLIDFYQSLFLCDQGDGNVAKETEFKSLGLKGVEDSKDGSVEASYVSADKYADIVILSN